jgi:hypothetical protein
MARYVNILPVYEIILELIVYDQVLKHIEENNILIKEQSGFRNQHSCESSLNFVLNKFKKEIENDKIIMAIFLDFKRAFETINRSITRSNSPKIELVSLCGFDRV